MPVLKSLSSPPRRRGSSAVVKPLDSRLRGNDKKKRRALPFQKLQYRFTAHLRDPKKNPAPAGLEARRLKIYADLFYNNVEGFLASGFPVLRKLTSDKRWHAMVRDFFSRHRSHTPLFHRIAEEFLHYLENERRDKTDPPFLQELAHYEWVELALSVALDPPPRRATTPRLSPLAWNLRYRFPVHRIGPDFQPRQPPAQPTHLVVYRTRDLAVKFMEANAVTSRLLQLLDGRRSVRTALLRIARELKHPQPQALLADGQRLLQDLQRKDIVLTPTPSL